MLSVSADIELTHWVWWSRRDERNSGIHVAQAAIHHWIFQLVRMLDNVFRRHKRSVGQRWRIDETYIKIKDQWKYLYRAVDTGKSGVNAAALATLKTDKHDEKKMTFRQSKYFDNLIVWGIRNIEPGIRPMLGFKFFQRAQVVVTGIKLLCMVRKGQSLHPTGDRLSSTEQIHLVAA